MMQHEFGEMPLDKPQELTQMTTCDYCRQSIPEKVHPFTLRMELFPAVEPSLQVSKKELEIDFEAEMKRLIDMMEKMDDVAVFQQEKLVHLEHTFTLCPECRHRLARQLDRLTPPRS